MQMHMHSHKKNITDDDCDDTTGDEVNDDGNGAMWYNDGDTVTMAMDVDVNDDDTAVCLTHTS